MSWPSIVSALRRQISSFRGLGDRAVVAPGGYLFMFQMSVASCHCPPIFRHTTTYLPVTCSGGCAFVLKLNVPISRAAPGPSDCTSTVVSLASPSCLTAPPQNFSMALCPFAISAPAGSTNASGVYIAAKALASPLLKAAIHSAFSFSIEFLACAQADEAESSKQKRKRAMRAIRNTPRFGADCPAISRTAQFSDLDSAFQVEESPTGDRDAVSMERAGQCTAAARQLARFEPRLAEAVSPIRDQRAMRRTGHRILVDAACRREEARHEIDPIRARRRGNDGKAIEPGDRGEIRRQGPDLVGALIGGEGVARGQPRRDPGPDCGSEAIGHRARRGRPGRKIERQ